MPNIDPNLNLLSGSANYTAGDWSTFGAKGSLDIRPVATLNRGFDLGISAEALITLDASIRKFIAIDASGFATASAGVRAQLQTPIDLFSEAGAALRLQAQAQAAVGVQVDIRLVVGDFLAVVDSDPRLKGAPARLVRVLLEETMAGGGAMAKAAVAAMAYVNVSATGRFIAQGTEQPGFTVAFEEGAGWGAGAGVKGFVNFGVADPRNLLRRSVDVAVDSTLDDLATLLGDPRTGQLLDELRTPLKVALRTTFEIGLELAQNGGNFSPNAAKTLALRGVQVFLEEAQRFVLDRAVRWAADQLHRSLGELPLTAALWNAASADRNALATQLRNIPREPFEATPANRTYWSGVVDSASRVFAALGGQTSPDDHGVEAIATIYAATQLLFIAVDRVSSGSARASVIGVNPVTVADAFTGTVVAPSPIIRQHINKTIGKSAGTTITQDALVTFLAEGRVLQLVAAASPSLETLASIAAGESPGAIGAGFSTILSNIGAFVPDGSGGVDPQATLAAILRGLRSYAQVRIDAELIPKLTQLLEGQPPELRTYLDEVLLSALNFTLDVVFTRILDWANGSTGAQTALREACSAVLMRLFGRSLVVTADAVLAHLLDGLSTAFADLAGHIDDPGGVARKLMSVAAMGPISRADLAEILSEHFLVLSQAAKPLDPDQRARIRDLLYQLIDTAPASPDAAFTDQLLTDLGVRNLIAGKELALEFGALWASRFVDFVEAWLAHVGTRILEVVKEVIDVIVDAVAAWIGDLEALARDLAAKVDALFAEIGQLAQELDDAMNAALDAAAQLATRLAATGSARTKLRSEIKNAAVYKCMSVLASAPGYGLVPGWAIAQVQSALRAAVDLLLNDVVVDPVLNAIRDPALAAADLLRDLRDIEPGDDLVEAVMDLFLDRLEDAIRDAFGGSGPHMDIRINFTARASRDTPLGTTSVSFDVDIPLGSVRIPLQEIIDAARAAARAIDAVGNAAEVVATQLAAAIHAELALGAAQTEYAVAGDAKAEVDTALEETYPASMDTVIVSPVQSTIIDESVVAQINLPGVPRAYLGLEPSQAQRVHVWLNQEELPMSGFAVSTLLGSLDLGRIDPGLHGRALGPIVASGSVYSSSATRGSARSFPVASTRREPHPLADLRNAMRASVEIPKLRPGRPLRLSERDQIEGRSFPAITISQRLTASMLVPGVNTLVVSVVDGRGRFRIERSVAFVVVPAAIRPKPPRGRPGLIKVPAPKSAAYSLEKMPASVRERLIRVTGAIAVGGRASAMGNGHRQAKGKDQLRPGNGLGPTWMATRAERSKTVEAQRKQVVAAIEAKRTPLRELREAAKSGVLRPILPPKPKRPIGERGAQ